MTILEIANFINDVYDNKISKREANKILLKAFFTKKPEKELKPSGYGIVVDKSKATKTFPLRTNDKLPYPDEFKKLYKYGSLA